jgi:hypothetical protein
LQACRHFTYLKSICQIFSFDQSKQAKSVV